MEYNVRKNNGRRHCTALAMCMMICFAIQLLCSCSKEPAANMQPEEVYETGDSVLISVGYLIAGMETKSAVNETSVEDVNLYIVNDRNDVVSYGYYTGAASIKLLVMKNMKYTVYAIANAGKKMHAVNLSEIENLVHEVKDASGITSSSGSVLMAGKSDTEELVNKKQVTVYLTRCVAKITLKANYSGLNSDVVINVKSVRIRNIPSKMYLFANNKIKDASEAINGNAVLDPSSNDLVNGIDFYQYENCMGTLQPDNTDQKNKVWPDDNPYSKTCSYIELAAEYSSARKTGNILYRFYLGKDMVSNYDIVRNTHHNITLNFIGDGGVEENTWRVDNSEIKDKVEIELEDKSKDMYHGEVVELFYSKLLPVDAKVNATSSNSNVVEIVEVTPNSIKVRALKEGGALITATVEGSDASSACIMSVERLTLEPTLEVFEVCNHFYYDIGYTVYPPRAADLGVVLELDEAASNHISFPDAVNYPLRIMGTNPTDGSLKARLSLNGRSDIYADMEFTVKNPYVHRTVELVTNYGREEACIRDLGLNLPPHANMEYTLKKEIANYYGEIADHFQFDLKNSKVILQNPNRANGMYDMTITTVGDDGTAIKLITRLDVYEALYLIGRSYTMSVTATEDANNPDIVTCVYQNGRVGKLVRHPNSTNPDKLTIYPSYEYSNRLYTIGNKEYANLNDTKKFTFKFEKGKTYNYAMGAGSFVFDGTNYPQYYVLDFKVESDRTYMLSPTTYEYYKIHSADCADGFYTEKEIPWIDIINSAFPIE